MKGLLRGLRSTKERLFGSIQRVVAAGAGGESLEELEEVLLGADVGVETAERIVARLRERAGRGADEAAYRRILAEELLAAFDEAPRREPPAGKPRVIVVVGVNGVGKTSTIGKLAHRLTSRGSSVLLAACDTFRAAAIDQLEVWAERAGVPIVRQQMGSDPAAVAFDAVQSARTRGIDVVIADTAGRLHTKTNLMDELKKIFTVLATRMPDVPVEGWLVLDAHTGQNSLRQAEAFTAALPLSGLVITKLDSTAKGGAAVAIQRALRVPILYAGFGEGIEDLEEFDPREFVAGIVGE